MHRLLTKICVIWAIATAALAEDAVLAPGDLDVLTGDDWTGTLTYRDYQSDRMVEIPAELSVSKDARTGFTLSFRYPEEPHMNGRSKVSVSNDGQSLNGATIIERTESNDTELSIVTMSEGEDNNLPATIRQTYVIGAWAFRIKKEVRVEGSAEFSFRNEFDFSR